MPAWVRRCLTLASVLIVWLVAPSALASAPLCDDRAASVLAPVPILDTPAASVNVGEHPDGCDDGRASDNAYHRRESTPRYVPRVRAEALCVEPVVLPAVDLTAVLARHGEGSRELAGVRSSLERPPRRAERA